MSAAQVRAYDHEVAVASERTRDGGLPRLAVDEVEPVGRDAERAVGKAHTTHPLLVHGLDDHQRVHPKPSLGFGRAQDFSVAHETIWPRRWRFDSTEPGRITKCT